MSLIRKIHPGIVLDREFLTPLGVNREQLAKELGWSRAEFLALCAGKRDLTPEVADKLGQRLKTGPGVWLRLQDKYTRAKIKTDSGTPSKDSTATPAAVTA